MWKKQPAKVVKILKTKNSVLIDINICNKLIIKIAWDSTKINKVITGIIKNWALTRAYTEIQMMIQVPFHSIIKIRRMQ